MQSQQYPKQFGRNYNLKKSKVLNCEHVLVFLKKAPSEQYLLAKNTKVIRHILLFIGQLNTDNENFVDI